MDKARGLKALQKVTEWNQAELAQKIGKGTNYVSRHLLLLEEPEEVVSQIGIVNMSIGHNSDGALVNSPITEAHIRAIRGVGLSNQDKITVINKAAREEPAEIQELISKQSLGGVTARDPHEKSITPYHIERIRPVKLSEHDRVTVLRKAAREGLGKGDSASSYETRFRTGGPRGR